MEEKTYRIPENLNHCLTILDEIFNDSAEDDREWFKASLEEEAVSAMHSGLGRWIRNTWGLWSKDTELYTVFSNMGLWHADDMSTVILTSYHRKINDKELNLKAQIQQHLDYWQDYEKTNGPVDKGQS